MSKNTPEHNILMFIQCSWYNLGGWQKTWRELTLNPMYPKAFNTTVQVHSKRIPCDGFQDATSCLTLSGNLLWKINQVKFYSYKISLRM